MKEKPSAQDLFSVTGKEITETPEKVLAECLRPDTSQPNGRLRPSISFDPADPVSVERAKKAARKQSVPPRMCGDYCPLPCTLRRLEDPEINSLMSTFGINNTGTDGKGRSGQA